MPECCHEWKKKKLEKQLEKKLKHKNINNKLKYIKIDKENKLKILKNKSKVKKKYLVKRYMLPSFLATWRTNKQSMSTRSYTLSPFFNKSAIDMFISYPQNHHHSSNAFLAQIPTCLLNLQPPMFTFSNPLSSTSGKRDLWHTSETSG